MIMHLPRAEPDRREHRRRTRRRRSGRSWTAHPDVFVIEDDHLSLVAGSPYQRRARPARPGGRWCARWPRSSAPTCASLVVASDPMNRGSAAGAPRRRRQLGQPPAPGHAAALLADPSTPPRLAEARARTRGERLACGPSCAAKASRQPAPRRLERLGAARRRRVLRGRRARPAGLAGPPGQRLRRRPRPQRRGAAGHGVDPVGARRGGVRRSARRRLAGRERVPLTPLDVRRAVCAFPLTTHGRARHRRARRGLSPAAASTRSARERGDAYGAARASSAAAGRTTRSWSASAPYVPPTC